MEEDYQEGIFVIVLFLFYINTSIIFELFKLNGLKC